MVELSGQLDLSVAEAGLDNSEAKMPRFNPLESALEAKAKLNGTSGQPSFLQELADNLNSIQFGEIAEPEPADQALPTAALIVSD